MGVYKKRRNSMKIEVTSPAKDELAKVLANKKDPSKLLRIYIAGYG